MEKKGGEERERKKATRIRIQQRDGEDKRADGLEKDEGARMIEWREENKIRWRWGTRAEEIQG